MKTLLICAHQDDESLSCGGLALVRHDQGHDVRLLTVFSRKYNYGQGEQYRVEQLRAYTRARGMLGIMDFEFHELEEGEPQKHLMYDLLFTLETVLSKYQPDEVVVPSSSDLNQDHRFLAECCMIALRPANLQGVQRVLAAHGVDGGFPASANWFLPLTFTQQAQKMRAIGCYEREARVSPHPRCPENVEALHRLAGSKAGVSLAEPYTLLLERGHASTDHRGCGVHRDEPDGVPR